MIKVLRLIKLTWKYLQQSMVSKFENLKKMLIMMIFNKRELLFQEESLMSFEPSITWNSILKNKIQRDYMNNSSAMISYFSSQ